MARVAAKEKAEAEEAARIEAEAAAAAAKEQAEAIAAREALEAAAAAAAEAQARAAAAEEGAAKEQAEAEAAAAVQAAADAKAVAEREEAEAVAASKAAEEVSRVAPYPIISFLAKRNHHLYSSFFAIHSSHRPMLETLSNHFFFGEAESSLVLLLFRHSLVPQIHVRKSI